MRYAWLAVLLALAACDNKPTPAKQDVGWVERSEEACGPGYLVIADLSLGGSSNAFGFGAYTPSEVRGRYCVPYKLPNEAMR